MKKLLLMTAALVATTGAFARKVKFQVDMAGQTVSSNGVHIAGNFKNPNGGADENPSQYNWDPSQNAMTNGGSGTIYSIIMDLQGQLTYDFKFVNDNGWGGVESVPSVSQIGGGNDNRFAYINNGTDTLVMPAIKFSGAAPANQYLVRIKVDMSLVSSVDTNGVHIAGSFQGWDPAKTRMVNHTGNGVYAGSIYTALLYVDSGTYAYKFVNGNAWGKDESVPSECAVNNNREVKVSANTVLDAVCYGKCGVCKVVPKYKITFNVDVESICGVDSVEGGIRNWEQITSASGNREVKLTSDSVMPANCFNTFGNCSPRPGSQKVTFKVDISKITPNGNQYVVIDYLGGKGAGAVRLSPMPGNPAVYQTTINDVCNGTVYYYFMNGDSSVDANAETFSDTADRACTKPNGVGGFQRELVRTSSSDLTLFYYFSSCKTSSTGIENNNNISENLKLYPNPTSTYSVIEFNDNSANHNVEIVDIAGRVIRTYENHKYNTLRIDRDELNAGIYFINVRNSNNQNGSIKLMID